MRLNVSASIAVACVCCAVLVGCDRRQTTNQESASETNDQHSVTTQPTPQAAATDPLCTVLNGYRSHLSTLSQQSNNEANPLKKATIEAEYSQLTTRFAEGVNTFFEFNQIEDYTGVISKMELQQYNGASGLLLSIDIPCDATIMFRFLDIRDPVWAHLDPQTDTPLPPWRSVLENLAVNDSVTFSGRFEGRGQNLLGHPFYVGGVITDLRKGLKSRDSPAAVPALTSNGMVFTRIVDAPRAQVWKAWTDPEQFKKWWPGKGFTSLDCKIDLRVGGRYLISARASEGWEFRSTGTYKEIVPLTRIVMTESYADEKGNVIPAPGLPADWPLELLDTLTLEDYEGKTRMTVRSAGAAPSQARDRVEVAWNGSLEELAESLK
jgi:uncharacterized protein YndB with AHSA1/START domain